MTIQKDLDRARQLVTDRLAREELEKIKAAGRQEQQRQLGERDERIAAARHAALAKFRELAPLYDERARLIPALVEPLRELAAVESEIRSRLNDEGLNAPIYELAGESGHDPSEALRELRREAGLNEHHMQLGFSANVDDAGTVLARVVAWMIAGGQLHGDVVSIGDLQSRIPLQD